MTNKNNNQTVEFSSYEQAQDQAQKALGKRNRVLIGLALSVLATGLTLFGLFGGHPDGQGMMYLALAFFTAIPAYILGGGFGKALKAAGKLAKFGWLIIPFPYDLITGFMTLIIAGFLFFCAPFFFVVKNALNANTEYNEAAKNLSYYTVAEQA